MKSEAGRKILSVCQMGFPCKANVRLSDEPADVYIIGQVLSVVNIGKPKQVPDHRLVLALHRALAPAWHHRVPKDANVIRESDGAEGFCRKPYVLPPRFPRISAIAERLMPGQPRCWVSFDKSAHWANRPQIR